MHQGQIKFNNTVKKLLEDFNTFPRARQPMHSGPNVAGPGPLPVGFLGGGLPGIDPSSGPVVLVKPKKKKKITKKKRLS